MQNCRMSFFEEKTYMKRAFSFDTSLNEVKFRDFVNGNLSLVLSLRELNFPSRELRKFGENQILRTVSEIKVRAKSIPSIKTLSLD